MGINRIDVRSSVFDDEALLASDWPTAIQFLSICRKNALQIFPRSVLFERRCNHRFFGRQFSTIADPESIRLICGPHVRKYRLSNLHIRMLQPALGNGLVVAEGIAWKKQRRHALMLLNQRKSSRGINKLIDDRIATFIDHLRARATRGQLDILSDLVMLSLDMLAISVFKYQAPIGNSAALNLINQHRKIVERADWLDALGISAKFASLKMRRAKSVVAAYSSEIEFALANGNNYQQYRSEDLGASMRDFVVSILTGFESVSVSINWCLALLALRPDMVEEIRSENVSEFSVYELRNFVCVDSWLDAFVLETLRLFPPLPLIYRTAIQDDELPIGSIRKGALLCLSPWIVHHHRQLWERPGQFMPCRWRSGIHGGSFMPFGLGARQCVGMNIGFHLVKRVVSEIARNFEILACNPSNPIPRAGLSLRPTESIRFKMVPISNR